MVCKLKSKSIRSWCGKPVICLAKVEYSSKWKFVTCEACVTAYADYKAKYNRDRYEATRKR